MPDNLWLHFQSRIPDSTPSHESNLIVRFELSKKSFPAFDTEGKVAPFDVGCCVSSKIAMGVSFSKTQELGTGLARRKAGQPAAMSLKARSYPIFRIEFPDVMPDNLG